MDGFDSSKGIIILGATNRPEVLDKALLRPGRFDRRIIVEKPDLKGRVDVLRVHSHDVLMDETVDLEEIALATSGAVGADLANMVNEAAIMAVKDGRNVVSQKDLFEAVEVVLAGKEKKTGSWDRKKKKLFPIMKSDMLWWLPFEKSGTGTENYDRASYNGSPWLCHAGAGRRKISDEKGRVDLGDHYPC